MSKFGFAQTLGARRVANVGPMGNLKTRLVAPEGMSFRDSTHIVNTE